MFGVINYGGFLVAAILLNLTPGADTLYILGRSITGGPRVGVASGLGISGGLVVHTLLVAFGLSVIMVSSAWLFWLIKVVGACYLVYLGIRAILSRGVLSEKTDAAQPPSLSRSFMQGVIVNVSNPKIALFFLAFLPQFVDSAIATGPLPFLLLGMSFIATSTIWSIILALGAGRFKRLLDSRPRVSLIVNRAAGVLYILLGISIFATPMPE
jgi:threonine/homoserine/homoserine lactone efflux protein